MNRLIYEGDGEGLVPAELPHAGEIYKPVLWTPGAVFARAVTTPADHLACCRRVLRLSMREITLTSQERTGSLLDAVLGQEVVAYKLSVWSRAVGWAGAIYGVRGALAFIGDDADGWRDWAVPGADGAELLIRGPDPTWIPGTSKNSRYHIVARTAGVIVAARFYKQSSGAGVGLRLRVEAPGSNNLLDAVRVAGNHLGWATTETNHLSAEPKGTDGARERIAAIVADALTQEKNA